MAYFPKEQFSRKFKGGNGDSDHFQDPPGHYYMKINWKLQNTKTKMSTAKNRNYTLQQIQILLNILSVHLLYLQLLWDFCFGKLQTIGTMVDIHVLTSVRAGIKLVTKLNHYLLPGMLHLQIL